LRRAVGILQLLGCGVHLLLHRFDPAGQLELPRGCLFAVCPGLRTEPVGIDLQLVESDLFPRYLHDALLVRPQLRYVARESAIV
jgi:hypothetical protein